MVYPKVMVLYAHEEQNSLEFLVRISAEMSIIGWQFSDQEMCADFSEKLYPSVTPIDNKNKRVSL
jgi:hypothetical protein